MVFKFEVTGHGRRLRAALQSSEDFTMWSLPGESPFPAAHAVSSCGVSEVSTYIGYNTATFVGRRLRGRKRYSSTVR